MTRAALKTLTYGVMHFAVAVCVAYALTGSLAIALGIGAIEPMVQTLFYALHERAWGWAERPRAHAPALAAMTS